METILNWGVVPILWLQHQFSPELDLLFKIFTDMGNEGFYLLLLPFVYWCVDRAYGARLAMLLVLWIWLEPRIENWLAPKDLLWQLAAAVGVPLVLILIFVGRDTYIVGSAGTLMGLGIGIALERKWLGFEAKGALDIRALRFLLGAVLLICIQIGLKHVFSSLGPAVLFRFFRYLIVGFWISFVSPWIFLNLRLAGKGIEGRMD